MVMANGVMTVVFEKRFLSEFLSKYRNLGTGDLRKTQKACRFPKVGASFEGHHGSRVQKTFRNGTLRADVMAVSRLHRVIASQFYIETFHNMSTSLPFL